MRKIETCSVFSKDVEKILIDNKITNWIWWDWFNIDELIKTILNTLEKLKIWKHSEWHQLYKDIYRLSVWHDLAFSCISSKIEFYFANYIFVRDLFKLLTFVWFFKRLFLCINVFIVLNKFWKKYSRHYNLRKKQK